MIFFFIQMHLYVFCVYLCMKICVICVCVYANGVQKRVADILELSYKWLTRWLSATIWVLGTKTSSSARTTSTLDHRFISPSTFLFLKLESRTQDLILRHCVFYACNLVSLEAETGGFKVSWYCTVSFIDTHLSPCIIIKKNSEKEIKKLYKIFLSF